MRPHFLLRNCITVLLFLLGTSSPIKANSDFESWLKQVERPNFTLIASKTTKDGYFAIFKAGQSRIAFCFREAQHSRKSASRLEITDGNGNSVLDTARSIEPIVAERIEPKDDGGTNRISEYQGDLLPIQEQYSGQLQIKYRRAETWSDLKTVAEFTVTKWP